MQNTIGKLDYWFPKIIYLKEDVLLDHLDDFENTLKETVTTNRNGMQQVNSSHLVADKLFEHPDLALMVDAINDHVVHFMRQLGYCDQQISKMRMLNMWTNISYENDYVFPHHHSGSIISGAFYVKAPLGAKIKFFNTPDMAMRPTNSNELNYEYSYYDCIPGRLLLFKSDFVHGTERQPAGEKIVVSFNIGY